MQRGEHSSPRLVATNLFLGVTLREFEAATEPTSFRRTESSEFNFGLLCLSRFDWAGGDSCLQCQLDIVTPLGTTKGASVFDSYFVTLSL